MNPFWPMKIVNGRSPVTTTNGEYPKSGTRYERSTVGECEALGQREAYPTPMPTPLVVYWPPSQG